MAGRHPKYECCTLWFCDKPHYGRGLCAMHYQNWLRTRYPLPKRDICLRMAVDAVEAFREVTKAFISGNNAYIITRDGDYTVSSKCRYCGESAQYKQNVAHKEECPVFLAERLMLHTQNTPPDDEFTYDF